MKTLSLTFLMLVLSSSIAAAQTTTQTFRNEKGQETGRATTDAQGNTTFYDNMGRQTGRAVTNGNTTTTYNPLGQQTGTIRGRK
jgi:hypothetical protein